MQPQNNLKLNFIWVMAKQYCQHTGDSIDAVNARRRRGEWLQGQHYIVRNRRIWINLEEVNKWLTKTQH